MIIALGLHRKRFSQSSGAISGLVEIECRKRAFWSAYTLDGYFSVILGRPRNFRDEDIDQHLPDRVNDADLTPDGTQAKTAYNQCVSDAPVFHAKLARIVGRISTDLYPTNKPADAEWIELAEQYTEELRAWKESLPAFLEPTKVDPSILIPIFQRQSTVLRLAYAHALILANRQSLLSNFADLSRRQEVPDARVEASLKECIDAAFLVVDTVNSFIEHRQLFKAFWFTHYISFCAIATLYVYTIQRGIPHQQFGRTGTGDLSKNSPIPHFEAAEKCQRKIAETTAKTSPFRRYNIILDELKKEVLLRLRQPTRNDDTTIRSDLMPQVVADTTTQRPNTTADIMTVERLIAEEPVQHSREPRLDGTEHESNAPKVYDAGALSYGFQTGTSTPSRMLNDPVLELSLFGSHGELVGWSEFDACAIGWPEGIDWNS
ncbi:Activator of stress genes 1 [Phlyctema vagabunda]|uniref:Activator of stress genes 1 n=1 Tax=Phlyctema vagabunda TaxID=108571 RepID=A0ABR4P2C3_9HELO